MSTKLEQKLRVVWNKMQVIGGPPVDLTTHRYVANSLNGGTGWGVYDRVRERFLTNAEVIATKSEQLANGMIGH